MKLIESIFRVSMVAFLMMIAMSLQLMPARHANSAEDNASLNPHQLLTCSISGPDYVCNNSSGIIYSGPAGMASYSWSISGAGSIVGPTNGLTVSVNSGDFIYDYTLTLTVTDGSGNTSVCYKTSYIYLFNPPVSIVANPTTACFGTTIDLSISTMSSNTVAWTGEGITNTSSNPSTTAIPTSTGLHVYGVTVTTEYGCVNTDTVHVQVNAQPDAGTISGTTSVCVGATTALSSNGTSGGTWSSSDVGKATVSSTGVVTGVAAGTSVITYTATAGGCPSSTTTALVTVNVAPNAGTISGTTTVCVGATTALSSNGASGGTWSSGDTGKATVSSSGVVTGVAAGTSIITYTVTGGGCTSSTTALVTVNAIPVVGCPGTIAVCDGASSFALTGGTPAGGTYSGTGVSSNIFNPAVAGPGTHVITYTYSAGGCSASCNFNVVVGDPLAPAITKVPNTATVCNGASLTVTSSGGSGGSGTCQNEYRFSTNNGASWSPWSTSIPAFNAVAGINLVESRRTCTGESCNSNVNQVSWQSTACSGTTISGNIIWENDDVSGVKTATVNVTGSGTGSSFSDASGAYSVTVSQTGNFTITPTKNINKLNGLSAADAAAVSAHVSGTTLITDPYKLVAADVNKNNAISSTDAALINGVLAGNPNAHAQFNTSWRFVPSSHTMTNPPWGFPEKRTLTNVSGTVSGQNFVGIKLGDIVATFANPANMPSLTPLVWQLEDKQLHAGDYIDVDFKSLNFNGLKAYQFALHFDPTVLQLETVQAAGTLNLTEENFGLFSLETGEIRNTWYDAQSSTLNDGTNVFSYRFKVLQGGLKLSDVLEMDDSVLSAEAYSGDAITGNVVLAFVESQSVATQDLVGRKEVLLLQNRPNPFAEQSAAGFILPESCDVQFRVFNAGGRLVSEVSRYCLAGYNEIQLDMTAQSPGLYYFELTTPWGVRSKKMLVVR